ncbi:Tat pathway signal sequence domain protein [gamma proteobacterium HTCC5015]|nr:Tat pathway signal sequence domain protein [gamma proteobacterium HTCC5015]
MSRAHQHRQFHDSIDEADDSPDHVCHVPDLGRRGFVVGGLSLALAACFGGRANDVIDRPELALKTQASPSLLGFESVGVMHDPLFDGVKVARGYRVRPLFSWGDAVLDGAAPWRGDASNDWREQLKQAGQNHDGMHFFPFEHSPNQAGLLVVNHEYINPTLHPNGFTETLDARGRRQRPLNEVRKEQAAHGLSIIEIQKDARQEWRTTIGPYNRRLTAMTPMQLSGPAAGSDPLKTASDPTGRQVLGTINNCAMGVTPWGTYLICEENWKNYFVNRDAEDYARRLAHHRYGITQGQSSRYYAWESVDERFNATPQRNRDFGGYVNEPNRFGWVVEVDPFDPASTPMKRTAMGRLVRECASLSLHPDGSMAFYSGDDTRGEYIYKFVPKQRWQGGEQGRYRNALDEGTLYVARFNDDGSGQWLPLVHGQRGLTADNGFEDQASVLIHARSAADRLGATTMDRPEWVAAYAGHPWVYATLTNNKERGVDSKQPVNAANSRRENHYGQIIRWRERGEHPAATEFEWEIFAMAHKSHAQVGDAQVDTFACPDALAFDHQGRLWIGTDFGDEESLYDAMGTNQLLCCDPNSGEVKRFLVGPWGSEITGLTFSPDNTTLWVNVQHPGGHYPAVAGGRPRSTTLAIQKEDGGPVGS